MTMRRLRLVNPLNSSESPATAIPIEEGGTMKVAFATHDLHRVDAHFASARTFMLFEVSADHHTLLEAIQFDAVSDEDGVHATEDGDDRLAAKIEALDGVALLFIRAIGGPAAARVVRRMVHPIKLSESEPIAQVISRVQAMMKGTPPPWLRKVMQRAEAGPARFVDEEEPA